MFAPNVSKMSIEIKALISKVGHVVDMERRIENRDNIGGREYIWSKISTDIKCWMQGISSNVKQEYMSRGMNISHRIFFSETLDILEGDRVDRAGKKYLVMGKIDAGGLGILWYVDVNETVE